MNQHVFSEFRIGNIILKNRIVRSATYEGACDKDGYPLSDYSHLYTKLAANEVGMIITGFAFTSLSGRAMQTAQAGIDTSDKVRYFRKVTDDVHKYNTPIVMQIAHAGRQTLRSVTGTTPISSSDKASIYFRQKPVLINSNEVKSVIQEFTQSAVYAKEAGFDGVQVHAAHGYLLHQFLLPETNILRNGYGIDKEKGIGTKLLEDIFDSIKDKCGDSFPVLVKISANHDLADNFYPDKFDSLIKFLHKKRFDAIEISYGSIDYPLNIFRGNINLETVFEYNPLFKTSNSIKKKLISSYFQKFIYPKFKSFLPSYNLKFAARAKTLTDLPVISVGGFRSLSEIEYAIEEGMADLVSLSRPFLCEPDLVVKMKNAAADYRSKCINCNDCVFMCDSGKPTTCYVKNSMPLRSVAHDKED